MDKLILCSCCGGFLDRNAAVCPHCDAQPTRGTRARWAVVLGLAGSASLGLTLMACYGAPLCEPRSKGCTETVDAGTSALTAGGDADAGTTAP